MKAAQLLQQGQLHMFADPPDYASAERCYRAAIDISPSWGELYHVLAFVLDRGGGDPEEATQTYRRAIELLPDDPRPVIALGELQRRHGDYEDAVRLLAAGIALRPHAEADARLMLANAYQDAGKTSEAIKQWRIVAAMEPSYPSDGGPIEEAKQKLIAAGVMKPMTTEAIQRWATAWIEVQEIRKVSAGHPLWWAIEQFLDSGEYRPTAEERWEAILAILHRHPSQRAIGMLAAGPLAELIDQYGAQLIERIEAVTNSDPAFRRLLSGVWARSTSEIWARVERARGA